MADRAGIGDGIVNSLASKIGDVAQSVVSATLNSLWPRDFELYMVSLELTDYRDKLLDYMTFPVNPDSISKTEPYLKNVDRAYGAVVVNKPGGFTPQMINIRGNFGKTFKVLLRTSGFSGDFSAMVKKLDPSASAQEIADRKDEISPFFKSGYGCLKVLQDICKRSNMLDDGKPRRLYFHNFPLGESYLVEVMSMKEDNSVGNNMIWAYDLQMQVITQINVSKAKRMALTMTGVLQNTVTDVVQSCTNALGQGWQNDQSYRQSKKEESSGEKK